MIPGVHWDHTVRLWSSKDVRGATFGDVTRTWSKIEGQDGVGMAIQAKRETRSDQGPGERVIAEYQGFADASMDIVEGDVVEVLSGPEASRNPSAPRYLMADSVYRPRNHHTQLVLIDWRGSLA